MPKIHTALPPLSPRLTQSTGHTTTASLRSTYHRSCPITAAIHTTAARDAVIIAHITAAYHTIAANIHTVGTLQIITT